MSTPNVRDVQLISRVLKIVQQLPVFRWGIMAMSENVGQRISQTGFYGDSRKKPQSAYHDDRSGSVVKQRMRHAAQQEPFNSFTAMRADDEQIVLHRQLGNLLTSPSSFRVLLLQPQ
jgi:hypothetical protein